jgi:long-subunit fatty acid transport protein
MMHKKMMFVPFLALPALTFFFADLHASNPGLGAKAASMATAFVAIADDPSAILHNPAGLTFLQGTQIYGGMTGVNIYEKLEQPSRAIETYHRCKKIPASTLGCEPSPRTQALYRSLRMG